MHMNAASEHRSALARVMFAVCVVAAGCASIGVHPAPLTTVRLPLGFEGTWVRATSIIHGPTAGSMAPPPAPDTLRLGTTASYRPDSVVPDLSDSAVQAMLESPGGSEVANKADLQGKAPPSVVVANTTVKVHGDTVVVESTVSSDLGIAGRSTSREYLSSDHTQLITETTIESPMLAARLQRQGLPAPAPTKRVVVYNRVS